VPPDDDVRPLRRSRQELAGLLVAAGRSVLDEEGLDVGAGPLTFKRVFDHLESTTGVRLTNASVIRRVWEDQEDFRTDVLVSIASTADSAGELDRTVEVLLPLLEGADLSTPEARAAALRELARVGGEASMRARLGTRDWSLWVGVWVLALTTPLSGRRLRIRQALEQGLASVTDVWESLFAEVCARLGLRVRAPLTLRQYTAAVSSMVEGSALRQGGDPELVLIERATGPGGRVQQWTLFGVCLEALAFRFLEVDPEWSPALATA
jgi:hypothetical protein